MTNDALAATRPPHPWVTAGRNSIRFGVVPLADVADWPAYLRVARMAEELGFDSIWLPDHPMEGHSCWTTLAAVAAATARIRLGSATSCISFRHPAVLARAAADVDRISQGRLILGIGIGDHADEFMQMGIPVLSVRERQQALEEAVHIVRGLWSEQPFTYHGTQFRVEEATGAPGPMQQPYVPLMIAGGGERVTLRQVAQYADVTNFGPHIHVGSALTLDDVRRKYDVLRRHCEAAGRDYDSILRSHVDFLMLAPTPAAAEAKVAALSEGFRTYVGNPHPLCMTPDEAIPYFRGLVAAGVQYFTMLLWPGDEETLRMLGEQVMPAVSAGGPAAHVTHSEVPDASTATAAASAAEPAVVKRSRWPWARWGERGRFAAVVIRGGESWWLYLPHVALSRTHTDCDTCATRPPPCRDSGQVRGRRRALISGVSLYAVAVNVAVNTIEGPHSRG
jgi:alkanesulfonate monooxygenase SsuD/methylene tetrahydromethanopterin reductase-like flavin-dependent oxidoreductase (luciferase family)